MRAALVMLLFGLHGCAGSAAPEPAITTGNRLRVQLGTGSLFESLRRHVIVLEGAGPGFLPRVVVRANVHDRREHIAEPDGDGVFHVAGLADGTWNVSMEQRVVAEFGEAIWSFRLGTVHELRGGETRALHFHARWAELITVEMETAGWSGLVSLQGLVSDSDSRGVVIRVPWFRGGRRTLHLPAGTYTASFRVGQGHPILAGGQLLGVFAGFDTTQSWTVRPSTLRRIVRILDLQGSPLVSAVSFYSHRPWLWEDEGLRPDNEGRLTLEGAPDARIDVFVNEFNPHLGHERGRLLRSNSGAYFMRRIGTIPATGSPDFECEFRVPEKL